MAKLRKKFWENHPLDALTPPEWEALCDGCGKCCLLKLEDADTGAVAFTNIACRLLDDATCRCSQYEIRKKLVPACVIVSMKNLDDVSYWLPATCAYKLLHDGQPLPDWHPLLTGDPNSVHDAGMSMANRTVSEFEVDEDDYEEYLIESFA